MIASCAVLLALSSGQKLGIAGVALAFIAFALVSSFLLPRRDPDFPGRGLRFFIVVTVAFFVAMMATIVFFAREEEAAHAEESAVHSDVEEQVETGGETTDQMTTTQAEGAGGRGDAERGKAVFASAGCGGCHAFEAAGSNGTAGPDLDASKPDYDAAVEQIANGGGGMPAFKGQLSDEQIADVAAFVSEPSGS